MNALSDGIGLIQKLHQPGTETHLNNFVHFGEAQLSVKGMNATTGLITRAATDLIQLLGHKFDAGKQRTR